MLSLRPEASWITTTPGNGPPRSGRAKKASRWASPDWNDTVRVLIEDPPSGSMDTALDGVAGLDPVLLATLVLVGILVAHGRQLPDDPRRGVSVEVGAVGDDEGALVWDDLSRGAGVLEPERAWQVPPAVGRFPQRLEQDEVVPAVHLLFELFPRYRLQDPLSFYFMGRRTKTGISRCVRCW